MEQAFMAYNSKENLDDSGFIEEDSHTWAYIQAAFHQSSTSLSGKISKVAFNITGVNISDQVDFTKGSSTHVVIAWECVRMILNAAAVSSIPCYNCYEKWG